MKQKEISKNFLLLFSLIFFFVFLLSLSISFADNEEKIIKSLNPKYQEWFKLVYYIILPQEKEVFLKLNNDRERDLFIETFWNMRDPTPGTPENEYKEEIIKRFNYVNKTFKRGSTREGWQTDMGRIYMILGPPESIERFEGVLGIVPCQAWTYRGDPNKGQPAVFTFLFFQRHGGIEYKLYDPAVDGPASLLQDKRGLDGLTYEELYEKIREIAPTLANTAISLIPGEYHYDFSPSPRYNILLAEILNSPKKDINPSYARHFLNYKGLVSTEYLTNFVDSEGLVEVIPDPVTGLNFIHFSVAPKKLSVDYYEPRDQYYIPWLMDVSLRDKDQIIFQYNRNMSIYFQEEELERIRGNGLSIEDAFPAADGQYQLTVLLRNPVSKEFTVLEKQVTINGTTNRPFLTDPLIAYRTEQFPQNQHLPFKIINTKFLVDPKNTLAATEPLIISFNVVNISETLRQGGKVKIQIKGLSEGNPSTKELDIDLSEKDFARINNYYKEISLRDMTPDYYEVRLILLDQNGQTLDQKNGTFIISAEKILGHPITQAKSFSLNNIFAYYYVLASQYDKLNQNEKAGFYYDQAFKHNPNYQEGLLDYCQFLIKTSQFDKTLELAERLKADDSKAFDYHLFRGLAYMGKGNYQMALEELLKTISIYDSDTRALNALGQVYLKTGQKEKARQVLETSLRLNPEQPEIRKLYSSLGKK
ncbi:MAG: GWxTD domain-containing protein [Candidatus Aminicenantes bacterium]|nr:GWxTD domain-containing protein [Candidatus Aminicenantes bacterium]